MSLFNGLFIKESIGLGGHLILGRDYNLFGTIDGKEWEFGGIFNIGIEYHFKPKKNRNRYANS